MSENIDDTAMRIYLALGETDPRVLQRIADVVARIGGVLAQKQVVEAAKIHANTGMARRDGKGKRSIGGIFFELARQISRGLRPPTMAQKQPVKDQLWVSKTKNPKPGKKVAQRSQPAKFIARKFKAPSHRRKVAVPTRVVVRGDPQPVRNYNSFEAPTPKGSPKLKNGSKREDELKVFRYKAHRPMIFGRMSQ